MNSSEVILYIGVSMMGFSIFIALISAVILHITGNRIDREMDADYGNDDSRSQTPPPVPLPPTPSQNEQGADTGELIASTYRILGKMGEGGGGIVYRGEHIRLKKPVVLKKDRRSITVPAERLRREVDTLKELSHTYIPKVYDFVQQGDAVYTVMDCIEGTSLDKPLERGVRFEQKRVIRWAKQLLEALCYLHSRPPRGILHADIKPANIMVTPQDEVCLIDFNIALFLKENGAVRVGYSEGYASPEHYGIDYSTLGMTKTDGMLETQLPRNPAETVLPTNYRSIDASKGVLLDVRSDIYSLGASLYHLLTGERPNMDATQVRPISEWEDIDYPVAQIIEKAMNPNPNLRFQTAAEMLEAFQQVRKNDPRAIHHRRRRAIVAVFCTLAFLLGGTATFVGLKRIERTQNAYKLAEYSSNSLRKGDVNKAISEALEALPEKRNFLTPAYTAQAQMSLTNALGVYDLSDGYKASRVIENLPSEPIKTGFSPDGSKVAVLVEKKILVFNTDTGEQVAELAAEYSALSDFVFRDNDTLIYAGEGTLSAYSFANKETLWSTGRPATGIALSGNGEIVASVYKDENAAVIYSAITGEALRTVTFNNKHQGVIANDVFADPDNDLFALNATGQWLAVSFSDGGLRVFNRYDSEYDLEIYDASEFRHFEGAFFDACFAFVSTRNGQSIFAVIDLSVMEQTGGFESSTPFHVKTDETGVYLSSENILVRIDPLSGEQEEVAYTGSDIVSFVHKPERTLVLTDDQKCLIFDNHARQIAEQTRESRIDFVDLSEQYILLANRDTPSLQLLKWESHSDKEILRYDSTYRHDEARLHSDRQSAILFRFDAFRIVDVDGNVISDVRIPEADEVFDQQYRRGEDSEYLEVIYNDGRRLNYSAKTGELLSETEGTPPDRTLYEELTTEDYLIKSPLHGKPSVYDSSGTKFIKELEEDAYITYATQIGDHLLTEYMTADGKRYGILLNPKCEGLARMPGLCDNLNGETLIFDDNLGHLRKSELYTLQELIQLGKERLAQSRIA